MPKAKKIIKKKKTKLGIIQKDQNICKVGVATIVPLKNVNSEKKMLASQDCNWSLSFTDLQIFTWIRASILCERDTKQRAATIKVWGEKQYLLLCGSTRCDFPLIGNHTPTGYFDPRTTWSCLWTVFTPSTLLFPSFPASLHHFVCVCVLMQPSANTDASFGFDAANGLYAFLKYIFGDIWKDRCGRIRRCEWRAV